jgi:signal recognition particle subunit SRP68
MPLHHTHSVPWCAAMDITKFILDYREAAFLLGDYGTYRAQLSRRLRIVRKKLGLATVKNAKYTPTAPVTGEQVAKNIEYERWEVIGDAANAM